MKEERQPLHGCLLCLRTSPRNTQLSSGSHHSHLSSLFREEAIVETLGSASPFAPAEHIEDVLELNPGIQIYVDLRKDGKNIKTVLPVEEHGISELSVACQGERSPGRSRTFCFRNRSCQALCTQTFWG